MRNMDTEKVKKRKERQDWKGRKRVVVREVVFVEKADQWVQTN